MTGHDLSLVLIALFAAMPATLTGIAGLVTSLHNRTKIRENAAKIHSLANGGGDRKVDERLAVHGLIDRRINIPEVKPSGSPPMLP